MSDPKNDQEQNVEQGYSKLGPQLNQSCPDSYLSNGERYFCVLEFGNNEKQACNFFILCFKRKMYCLLTGDENLSKKIEAAMTHVRTNDDAPK